MARKRKPKVYKLPTFKPGLSLGGVPEDVLYKMATGKGWDEVDPEPDPEDFGALGHNVVCMPPSYWDAWHRWYDRRTQFEYSPRKRNAKEVLATACVSHATVG